MRGRGQLLAALLVLVAVASGGVYLDREVGARPLRPVPPGTAPSGAWLCPHGGGKEWTVRLALANPGKEPVRVRLTALSGRRPRTPRTLEVPGRTEVRVEVPASVGEAATYVEFFGGWAAAGWVSHAGGGESGVAAEPCLSEPGRRLLLPDGNTEREQETSLLVMNPFASDAVLTITLLTQDGAPVTTKEWSDVVLPARRSAIFHVNDIKLGERTVSAVVDVGVGRVGAASLGLSGEERDVRTVIGVPATAPRLLLPGAGDTGQSELVVMTTADTRDTRFAASLLGEEGSRVVDGLEEARQAPGSARTYPVLGQGAATIEVHVEDPAAPGLAAVRRTLGPSGDPAAIVGATAPASAWVVLPTVAGSPSHPRLVLANPGTETVRVVLSVLPGPTATEVADPITVRVPGGSTVGAPGSFLESLPGAALLAVSEDGPFVAASASSSLGREGFAGYAAALGVPVPPGWVPPPSS